MKTTGEKRKVSLTVWIFIALILGVIAGILLQGSPKIAETYIAPLGTIFLNLVKMVVVPVVLFSIMQGVISLQDIRKVGSIGGKTVAFYICTTAFAVTLGLVFANMLNVGSGYKLDSGMLEGFEAVESPSFIDTIVNIFPSNAVQPLADATMLQIIVIALFFGFGVIIAGEKGKLAGSVIESFSEVSIKVMGIIIKFSPIGVFGLITPVIATNGVSVLLPLLKLIGVAYLVSIIHMVVVYSSAVKAIGKISPIRFFKEMSEAMLFAFSSASSVGTLPFNMECTKRLGVKKEVSSFVLPLGATINIDLSGRVRCIYRPDIRHGSYHVPAADRYPDGDAGFHRNRRGAGLRSDHAVHGASERGTSAGRNRACCRNRPYPGYGPDNGQYYRRCGMQRVCQCHGA